MPDIPRWFWGDIMLCSLVYRSQYFRGAYYVHFLAWKWTWQVTLTLMSTKLHGIAFQKIVIFVLTAVRIWNFTLLYFTLMLLLWMVSKEWYYWLSDLRK